MCTTSSLHGNYFSLLPSPSSGHLHHIFRGFYGVVVPKLRVFSNAYFYTLNKKPRAMRKQKPARTVRIRVLLSGLHVQTFCLDDIFPQKIRDFPSELQIILESHLIYDRMLF
jgi:hypothetical protein